MNTIMPGSRYYRTYVHILQSRTIFLAVARLPSAMRSWVLIALLAITSSVLSASRRLSISSSDETACPEQLITFTCMASATVELRWNFLGEEALFFASDNDGKMLQRNGFHATLTESVSVGGNLRNMTSVLSTTAEVSHNRSVITCGDGYSDINKQLNIAGVPSPPMNLEVTEVDQSCTSATMILMWGPPGYSGNVAITLYTVTVGDVMQSVHGTTATVSVQHGYEQQATLTATNCVETSLPVHKLLGAGGCRAPTPPPQGYIISPGSICTRVGSTVQYQCNPGLAPQGIQDTVCLSDGTWSPNPFEFICFVDCSDPPPLNNGYYHQYDSTEVNAEIVYQCSAGYLPQEERTSVCTAVGRWNPDPQNLECKVDCHDPPSPVNGTLDHYDTTAEGSVVFYRCNSGLFPRERYSSVCTPAGVWDPDPIELLCRDPVDCGFPTPPTNGSLIRNDSTLEGTEIFYQCSAGLIPAGCAVSVCTADEQWTPELTCREPATCSYPIPSTNGLLTSEIAIVESSMITFRCKDGHVPAEELIAFCTSDGEWIPDPSLINCVDTGVTIPVLSATMVTSIILALIIGFTLGIVMTRLIMKKKLKTTRLQEYEDTVPRPIPSETIPMQTSAPAPAAEYEHQVSQVTATQEVQQSDVQYEYPQVHSRQGVIDVKTNIAYHGQVVNIS